MELPNQSSSLKESLREHKRNVQQSSLACQRSFHSGEVQLILGSGMEEGDCSTINHLNHLNVVRLESLNRKINQIDHALEKIDQGNYGLCSECQEEIHADRLRALPFATNCRACQDQLEQRGRGRYRLR